MQSYRRKQDTTFKVESSGNAREKGTKRAESFGRPKIKAAKDQKICQTALGRIHGKVSQRQSSVGAVWKVERDQPSSEGGGEIGESKAQIKEGRKATKSKKTEKQENLKGRKFRGLRRSRLSRISYGVGIDDKRASDNHLCSEPLVVQFLEGADVSPASLPCAQASRDECLSALFLAY